MVKVGIIGTGGREHALGWSSAQSPDVDEVIYFSGNAWTGKELKGRNIKFDLKPEKYQDLYDLVIRENIEHLIVGPEQPLVDDIVGFFNHRGFDCIFGPGSRGSAIEADKFFSYDIMENAGIFQAQGIKCESLDAVIAAIKTREFDTSKGIVLKARGLTGGKGVSVYDNIEEALKDAKNFVDLFGKSGVLVSERLFGDEYSIFGISDGEKVTPFLISIQDHKRLLDGDKGPNTGGMGAYGPTRFADEDRIKQIAERYMTSAIEQMRRHGIVYKGFLYAGMIDKVLPKVLEFNCRFGDPEAQPSMMMMNESVYDVTRSAVSGLTPSMTFKVGSSCCVVMAANGYPGKDYLKNFEIGGLDEVARMSGVKVFHAGTSLSESGQVISTGGRVLGVTAYAEEGLVKARELAYEAVRVISEQTSRLNGNKQMLVHRTDIGMKGLN